MSWTRVIVISDRESQPSYTNGQKLTVRMHNGMIPSESRGWTLRLRRLTAKPQSGLGTARLGERTLHFHYRDDPETVVVTSEGSDAALQVIYAFWFAWHAMWPQDVPAQSAW